MTRPSHRRSGWKLPCAGSAGPARQYVPAETLTTFGAAQAMAVLASYAADWLDTTEMREFRARLHDRIRPHDVLVCAGDITAVQHDGAQRVISVALTAVRPNGQVLINGSAVFVRLAT